MKTPGLPNTLSQKKIPTVFGLIILIVGLVVGVVFIGKGPGVFSPRATAETTPKNVHISNVTDRSFTVSYLTDGATTGFVKFGSDPSSMNSVSADNRDQVSGSDPKEYQVHYVTVRGLNPASNYYFLLGTNSNTFDNNGSPFSIKTAPSSGAPPAARTISGTVLTPEGGPAEGSIVYVTNSKMEEMSSLVSSSGSWAIPLSDARKIDGGYAQIEDTDQIAIKAQGNTASLTSLLQTTVSEAHPFPAITLGSSEVSAPAKANSIADAGSDTEDLSEDTAESESEDELSELNDTADVEPSNESSDSASLDDLNDETSLLDDLNTATPAAEHVVDLEMMENEEEVVIVTTSEPIIRGKVAPNTPIRITINSEEQIETELVTNEDGTFEVSLEELKKELEPGDHTVTYSYIEPGTNEEITRTFSFVVEIAESLVTQANAQEPGDQEEDEPFGSANPYPMETATPTPTPTPTPTATPSATPATDSGEVSTRSAVIATESSLMESGSVGTTMALVFGGLFFLTSGVWSFWISNQIDKNK